MTKYRSLTEINHKPSPSPRAPARFEVGGFRISIDSDTKLDKID